MDGSIVSCYWLRVDNLVSIRNSLPEALIVFSPRRQSRRHGHLYLRVKMEFSQKDKDLYK